MGYSSRSKAYMIYNKRLKTIVESIDVKFDEEDINENTKGKDNDNEREIGDNSKGNEVPTDG